MWLFNYIAVAMEKVIHIFDMDDTVLETPTFADFVGAKNGEFIDINKFYPDYFEKIKSTFTEILSVDVDFMRMHDFVVPINKENNKYFDGDLVSNFIDKKHKRMFENHKGVLVLRPFPGFHADPDTLGATINTPVYKDYINAENKMILTGRDDKLANLILQRFDELEIEHPNYGLKTFTPGRLSIEQFKIQTICKSIQEFGWTVVHFYEDRKDWLLNAMAAVTELFPGVTFHPHLITNVKDKMKIN